MMTMVVVEMTLLGGSLESKMDEGVVEM